MEESSKIQTVRYFNKTHGPLPISLNPTTSCSLAPQRWTDIPAEFEGCAQLRQYIRKGKVMRDPLAGEVTAIISSQKQDNGVQKSSIATPADSEGPSFLGMNETIERTERPKKNKQRQS